MTQHLLHIALGPVQDFIAQARRTGDLWYGSHLISELSRTAARELMTRGAHLLIPALDPAELAPCSGITRPDGIRPLAVANKLYALVGAGVDPHALANQIRDHVAGDLKKIADRTRDELREKKLLPSGIGDIWDEQVDTFLDFSAAWIPYVSGEDLARARQQVDEAAGARRLLRDFGQWQHARDRAAKSSLDGVRDSLLPSDKRQREELKRLYGIPSAEELDAIGLLKRVQGSSRHATERFVPIINVALAPWLEHLAAHAPEELGLCKGACADLEVQPLRSPGWTRTFPYEGSILLPSRWRSLADEQGYDDELAEAKPVPRAVRELHKAASPYEPYVACLVADGDKMGEALTLLVQPEALREFSHQLSRFAQGAPAIVEAHHGALVYAGGDDVLAFVPVAHAVACAEALHREFGEIMRAACTNAGIQKVPTLSVGLGIGHYMESMGTLLELGRRAERLAKGDDLPVGEDRRNALAIIVHKRSGSERLWRMRWDRNPKEQLDRDVELLQAGLPIRKVYEIHAALGRLPRPDQLTTPGDKAAYAELLTDELRRMLRRSLPTDLDSLVPDEGSYESRRDRAFAQIERLLIARAIHEATPRRPLAQGDAS